MAWNDVNGAVSNIQGYQTAAHRDAWTFGADSSHGFKSIFKSEDARNSIITILNHMILRKGLLGLKPDPNLASPPRYACAHPELAPEFAQLDLGYDPWWKCQTSLDCFGKPIALWYAAGTAYIFICPTFIVLEAYPTHQQVSKCPDVSSNRFIGSSETFYQNEQYY